MNAREERGLVIAAICKLRKTEDSWLVPSQSGERIYQVNVQAQTCTCPDHQDSGFKCKHIYAAEFTMKREVAKDGTVTETQTMTFTKKVTYKQDWPIYNEAQQSEKSRFLALLFDLTRGVPEVERDKSATGRKPIPMRDQIFAAAFKVYSTVSTRRFACDLADAYEKRFLSRLMNSISISTYLENPDMTPILHSLIEQASLPLKAIETVFAPDSTGFSSSRFVRWYDEKYGVTRTGHDWVKAHAICGVKTHIVTAIEIHNKDAADCPQFKSLVKTTAKNFVINEVAADKAYLSHENLEQIDKLGGTAYIPFKSNSVPGEKGSLWEKMFHFYQFKKEEFGQHYHKRSNAESVFSMVKGKFRDNVMSKSDVAMKNEVLCKFLCHNICCVIMSHLELGIEPVFWKNESVKVVEPIREEVRVAVVGQAAVDFGDEFRFSD
jgi:transposase